MEAGSGPGAVARSARLRRARSVSRRTTARPTGRTSRCGRAPARGPAIAGHVKDGCARWDESAEIDDEQQEVAAPVVILDVGEFLDGDVGEHHVEVASVDCCPDRLVCPGGVSDRVDGVGVEDDASHGAGQLVRKGDHDQPDGGEYERPRRPSESPSDLGLGERKSSIEFCPGTVVLGVVGMSLADLMDERSERLWKLVDGGHGAPG